MLFFGVSHCASAQYTKNLDDKFSEINNELNDLEFLVELFSDYDAHPNEYVSTLVFNEEIVASIVEKKLVQIESLHRDIRVYFYTESSNVDRADAEAALLSAIRQFD